MWRVGLISLFIWAFTLTASATERKYASIIVDADTLEIIHARQIDELRYPASLTKVMTLYLTCLLYTSPSPRDLSTSRMPSSA